jgi:hypothetical protein
MTGHEFGKVAVLMGGPSAMYRDVRVQARAGARLGRVAMYRDVRVQARAGARLGRVAMCRDAAALGHPGLRGISTSCTSRVQARPLRAPALSRHLHVPVRHAGRCTGMYECRERQDVGSDSRLGRVSKSEMRH